MTSLNDYLKDGANNQARAVLSMLQGFNIEESWDDQFHRYKAEPMVSRWQNCREQGYVLSLVAPAGTLQIAWFEHRNSDDICAIKWEQSSFPNSPTIETADFGGACYKDKYDVSHSVGYGEIVKMADWIGEQLTAYWQKPANKSRLAATVSK